MSPRPAAAATLVLLAGSVAAQSLPWYTQGDFHPVTRFALELSNPLDIDRQNVPVAVRREQLPLTDLHEMTVTVVDPSLPPAPEPTAERIKLAGGHERRAEAHGHALLHQLDDLDKDGVWDELFFVTDIPAAATKTVHVYVGMNQRGWNPHETHAGIGSYCRHLVAFWESKHIGWKLWFPTSVDVYGKREPILMAHRLYMENLDGYGVTLLDPALGSDIQSVDVSLGAGGIGVFERPDAPAELSVPRFTPAREAAGVAASFNAGPVSDTRYSFDVVVNGPVRSMVRVRTMNWQSGRGRYEVEQLYTAYAHQSYSTCRVSFPTFQPQVPGAVPAAGIRKKPNERHFYQRGGVAITAGPEAVMDPDSGTIETEVEFIASAIVVNDEYRPQYQFVAGYQGNHTFRVTPRADGSFEYLIAGAWSEGRVHNTPTAFEAYVQRTAREYGAPLRVRALPQETRQ